MRRWMTALVLFLSLMACQGQTPAEKYVTTPEDEALAVQVMTDLKGYADEPVGDRMVRAAEALLGQPYVAGTLEEPEQETLCIYLTRTDCILFVETCLGLVRAAGQDGSFETLARELRESRYRDGVCGRYEDRLHYTTEWARQGVKRGVLQEMTGTLGGVDFGHPVHYMSRHPDSYKRMTDVDAIAAIERHITRKADVRNFTYTTLSDILVKLEGFNEYLTVDTTNLEQKFENEKKKNLQQNQNNKDDIEIKNYRKEEMAEKSTTKKRNFSFFGIGLKKNLKKNRFYSTHTIIDTPKIKDNLLFNIEEEKEINNRLISIDISNKINLDNIQINNFFYQTDVTLEYLNQVLAEYEKIEKPDCIVNAMKDFIDLQINQISSENNEIYSNYVNNNNIKTYIALNNKENTDCLGGM